ncbi:MAG TPA: GNAT family N-acetyltransferase [Actinomycetota bacterium]|nr:GNAT family N-acetyltransferase [Actinomycetota bacterium]
MATIHALPLRTFRRQRRVEVTLLDGTRVVMRPIEPVDRDAIAEGFEHLSEESRYRRFMGGVKRLTPPILEALTDVDHNDHEAWVAYAPDDRGSPGVGVARYVRLKDDPQIAEPAVTVIDEYQGRGLGTMMMDVLARDAVGHGIRRFRAYVLVENMPIIKILRRFGANLKVEEPGVYRADIDLDV